MKQLSLKMIRSLLKPREESSHKGDHGHALLIAGSKGKTGAAIIASKACLRAGLGLLTVSIPETERLIIQTAIPEAMAMMREIKKINLIRYTAIGIGPGMGTDKDSEKLITRIIKTYNKPMVIDADALTMIAGNKTLLKKLPEGTIITPHPKEFDRIFGPHKNDAERIETAIKKAKEYMIIIVLKGHRTVVTFNNESFINTTGNAGLAKGGSGDALTGMITSFLAQGYKPFDAAKLGVYIHGLTADITLKEQSTESMLITDAINNSGNAFKLIYKSKS